MPKSPKAPRLYFYYPTFSSHSFESEWIYLGIELQEKGTVQFMVKFESEKFQSNLLRHTKSSAALITTKKLPDSNYK